MRGIPDYLAIALFSSWPVINFIFANVDGDVLSGSIWWSCAGLFLGSFVVAALCIGPLKLSFVRYALPTSVIGVFSFGLWLSFVEDVLGISDRAAYVALSMVCVQIGASALTVRHLLERTTPRVVFYGGLLVLFVPSLTVGAAGMFTYTNQYAQVASSGDVPRQLGLKAKPNIYFIILDMYARRDVLVRELGLDNSGFLEQLTQRGFIVDDQSLTNYPVTYQTISTSFNMAYYGATEFSFNIELIQGRSPVVERLRSEGYQFVFIESGGTSQVTCGGFEDLCVRGGNIRDDVALLLKMTPLWRLMHSEVFLRHFEAQYVLTRVGPSVDEALDYMAESGGQPTLVFAHILSPHEPPRYEEDCDLRFRLDPGLGDTDVEGYKTDLVCLNSEVIDAVDSILGRDTTDPVILIQSDHGIGRNVLETEDKMVRMKNLMTFRLPEACRGLHYPGLTPVNNFRLVFACLFGTPFEPVPDRYFRWEPVTNTPFGEVDREGRPVGDRAP